MKKLTFTNAAGDTLTVECGGTGGDNVLGTVEEKSGNALTAVKDAAVTVANTTENETEDTTTNRNGEFDVDVDAGCNDLILVRVTWVGADKKRHTINASFRCQCDDEEEGEKSHARVDSADRRFEKIARLEAALPDLIAETAHHTRVAQSVQWETLVQVIGDLAALAAEGEEQQKEALDKRILDEAKRLLDKLQQYGPSPPPPDIMWLIMLEMIALIFKLISKAFLLQKLPLPEFPLPKWFPDGQGPGGGIKPGDLT